MSLLWAIPPLAVVAGALLLVLQLRAVQEEAEALERQLRQLGEVRVAVRHLRAEAAALCDATRGLRAR